ncbi:MAG: flagellar biosynthetic protein FliR [Alphaproteobacteria bacterium]|nr:flagellar biosynthetic protein FliR [Alphaproteobacteria bacterium]
MIALLLELLPGTVFAYLIAFARIGAVIMLLPGVGEDYIPARIRLALALMVAAVIAPTVGAALPPLPAKPVELALSLGAEIAVGLGIGLATRFLLSAMQTAGTIVSNMSGLAIGSSFDPTSGTQGTEIGVMMNLAAVAVVFATDTHHLLLRAAADSYLVFPPTGLPPTGDFADLVTRLMSYAFVLAIQISAPFLVYGVVINTAMGLVNRMMPSMQVFFVLTPVQTLLAIAALMAAMPAMLAWFAASFEARMAEFMMPR